MITPLVRGEVDPGDWVNHNCLNKTKVSLDGLNWLYPFGADSLSRSVHCAPDENDRPSERTKIF